MIGKDDFNSISSLDTLRAVRAENAREIKVLYERLTVAAEKMKDCLKPKNVMEDMFVSFAPLLKLCRHFFR